MNRSRVHSEGGSEEASGKEESDSECIDGPRFALERSCLHCALVAEYRWVNYSHFLAISGILEAPRHPGGGLAPIEPFHGPNMVKAVLNSKGADGHGSWNPHGDLGLEPSSL